MLREYDVGDDGTAWAPEGTPLFEEANPEPPPVAASTAPTRSPDAVAEAIRERDEARAELRRVEDDVYRAYVEAVGDDPAQLRSFSSPTPLAYEDAEDAAYVSHLLAIGVDPRTARSPGRCSE